MYIDILKNVQTNKTFEQRCFQHSTEKTNSALFFAKK